MQIPMGYELYFSFMQSQPLFSTFVLCKFTCRRERLNMLRLQLGPVYSRLASGDDLKDLNSDVLPASYELRLHQAQTWRAFERPDVDIIFDTALTGDGKSLAGQLPMFVAERYALLLYPTNELIKDQVKQVVRYTKNFGLSRDYQVMYSESISEEIERSIIKKRSSVIQTWLKNRDYILSNPDLFHLLGSYNYGNNLDKRENTYLIPENLDYILFDEFHIFGPPQILSVLNILNYQRVAAPHHRLKYVFLSATPTPMFKTLLKNSGFQIEVIEGQYSPLPAPGYTRNPIVQPVNFIVHPLNERGAYAWAQEHMAEIKDFYRMYSKAKGVFIVNSIATAKCLVAFYKRELAGCIEVGENTALTHADDRFRAMNDPTVQLIIATSTVDVGVDFAINLLIFESTDAGTFIQRLGRLGRHEGWSEYRAYALLPDWMAARFALHFTDGSLVERVKFLETIRDQNEFVTMKNSEITAVQPIFQPEQHYKNYAGCWGGLQAAHIIASAEDWQIGKIGKKDLSRALREQYNSVYRHATNKDWIGGQVKRYQAMSYDKEEGQRILAELLSFRGRSPLDCGIYDETDQHFKRYNLFFLLANTVFYPLKENEFRRMVEASNEDFEKYRSHELQLYARLTSYEEVRENFMLASDISFQKKLYQVHVYDNFWIEDSRILAQYHLDDGVNNMLASLPFVSLVCEGTPREFKRRNNLNLLFPVHQMRDGDGIVRSIIFGQNALLAHSLVFWRAVRRDCDELFIM
jgi:CRISPR-associated endonuclease/helicase Cas3